MKRLGKLKPCYNFVLNPYHDARFTSCPKCNGRARQRKVPLVIHLDPKDLVALNKTCRYCPSCDLLIAHKDEIEAELAALFARYRPELVGHDYLVIGTLERAAWRRGRKTPLTTQEMLENLHDLKHVLQVEPVHYGWVRAE
jgi:hypothetical protein